MIVKELEELEPIKRLNRDLKKAAKDLTATEARFLVDAYYIMQKDRIRADHQQRTLEKAGEPNQLLGWLSENTATLERNIKSALGTYSQHNPVGKWAESIIGIGPVISAGLLAHIDITKAPTVGHIWSFAGLNPTMKWEEGKKRPWNGALKRLCVHPSGHVLTRRGSRPIADVSVGDEVLTHLGRWRRVTKVMINLHDGLLYGLRSANAGTRDSVADGRASGLGSIC